MIRSIPSRHVTILGNDFLPVLLDALEGAIYKIWIYTPFWAIDPRPKNGNYDPIIIHLASLAFRRSGMVQLILQNPVPKSPTYLESFFVLNLLTVAGYLVRLLPICNSPRISVISIDKTHLFLCGHLPAAARYFSSNDLSVCLHDTSLIEEFDYYFSMWLQSCPIYHINS